MRSGGIVLVVAYCCKGVHRSVAFACILRSILVLETWLRVSLLETFHASARVLWAREYCNECRDCRQHSTCRDAAIDKAHKVWRALVSARACE